VNALAADSSAIRIGRPRVEDAPFRFFFIDNCLNAQLESDLLDWFETEAPWRLVETDFYEQYEFSLLDVDLPESLRDLIDVRTLAAVRNAMSDAFGTHFDNRITLVAHKLIPGQRIAIHNDLLDGEETHRLTIQLNRGLVDADGGFFMLFNSPNAADIHKVFRPVSGMALGFEIGPDSHHAVSTVHGGERYTLVLSLYAEPQPLFPN